MTKVTSYGAQVSEADHHHHTDKTTNPARKSIGVAIKYL